MGIYGSPNDILIPPALNYLKKLKPLGHLSLSEGLTLCWLASMTNQNIVDIGSNRGRSACFLAAGSHIGNKQKITCIDPWDLVDSQFEKRDAGRLKAYATPEIRRTFNKQIRPFRDLIIATQGYSVQVAERWTKPVALIFIDGHHWHVLEDFEAWYPYITEGGVMAFHDIQFNHVAEQIAEIKRRDLLKNWTTVNRLVYAQKK